MSRGFLECMSYVRMCQHVGECVRVCARAHVYACEKARCLSACVCARVRICDVHA